MMTPAMSKRRALDGGSVEAAAASTSTSTSNRVAEDAVQHEQERKELQQLQEELTQLNSEISEYTRRLTDNSIGGNSDINVTRLMSGLIASRRGRVRMVKERISDIKVLLAKEDKRVAVDTAQQEWERRELQELEEKLTQLNLERSEYTRQLIENSMGGNSDIKVTRMMSSLIASCDGRISRVKDRINELRVLLASY